MIKTIIADDEEIIRRGLGKMVAKDSDIQVVALAEDGEMALELIEQHKPDLLLVDINMPFLGGLELIEKLRQQQSDLTIVVITGYDDFAYAQQAIRLGVSDYLLKPVTQGLLQTVLCRVKETISTQRKKVDYFNWAKEQVEKNHRHLASELLRGWVEGRDTMEEITRQGLYLGQPLPIEPLCLSFINLDNTQGDPSGTPWDESLLFYAAENIAQEIFAQGGDVLTTRSLNGGIILLSHYDAEKQDLLDQQCHQAMERYLPVEIHIYHEGPLTGKDVAYGYDAIEQRRTDEQRVPETLVTAWKLIEQNYSDSGFSLQTAADTLLVSPQHLGRLFRTYDSGTFSERLAGTRIRHALHLLQNPQNRIYEIAEQTGYATQHYFSTAFKKALGVSPAEYRKKFE